MINEIERESVGLFRKPIHIFLYEKSHKDLKKFCKENRLTMQEIVEHFLTEFLDGKKEYVEIVQKLSEGKKKKSIKRITESEADSIYDAIEALAYQEEG